MQVGRLRKDSNPRIWPMFLLQKGGLLDPGSRVTGITNLGNGTGFTVFSAPSAGAKLALPHSGRMTLMPIRILIADDDSTIRMLLRRVVETHPAWQVCSEAAN